MYVSYINGIILFQFSSVQSLSHVQLFVTPWITARQALSITNSRSSFRLTSIESVMPSSHLNECLVGIRSLGNEEIWHGKRRTKCKIHLKILGQDPEVLYGYELTPKGNREQILLYTDYPKKFSIHFGVDFILKEFCIIWNHNWPVWFSPLYLGFLLPSYNSLSVGVWLCQSEIYFICFSCSM